MTDAEIPPEKLTRAELDAIRDLSESVKAQTLAFGLAMESVTRALEKLSEKVDDVDKRLIRVEEAKHGRDIERLETALSNHAAALRDQMGQVSQTVGANTARIDSLERTRDQHDGMGQFMGWVHKFGPWFLGAMAAAAAWFGIPPPRH